MKKCHGIGITSCLINDICGCALLLVLLAITSNFEKNYFQAYSYRIDYSVVCYRILWHLLNVLCFDLVSVGGCFNFEERSCGRRGLDGGKRTYRRLVCIELVSEEASINLHVFCVLSLLTS